MFRKLLMVVPIATMAIGGTTACATKKFVRTSVGEVNDKVDSLGRSVEQTQERTRANEAKIDDVDKRAQAAAQDAKQSATAAQSVADRATSAATTANSSAAAAAAKAEAVERQSKRLVYEIVLNEDQGNFTFGKKDLPEEVMGRLDQMIQQLKADPKGAYFEIEGHTDAIGSPELNEKLGLERAEAVKRYLYEHHQIPLHKINTISYGQTRPVADNKTKAGRAQNRRVVIKVLA